MPRRRPKNALRLYPGLTIRDRRIVGPASDDRHGHIRCRVECVHCGKQADVRECLLAVGKLWGCRSCLNRRRAEKE